MKRCNNGLNPVYIFMVVYFLVFISSGLVAFSAEGDLLEITVEEAILIALENNQSLKVERFTPSIQRTFEGEEESRFDPVFDGGAGYSREKSPETSRTTGDLFDNTSDMTSLNAGLSKYLSTGTEAGVDLSTNRTTSDLLNSDEYETRLGLSLTQALLRGRGREVNLASLRQARLNTEVSQYELRGFTEALVAQVEYAYWDFALADRQVKILEDSLDLAEQQLWQTEQMIQVGSMAETELAAAKAEIAFRRQNLINARSNTEVTRLRLLRLLNPSGPNIWERKVNLLVEPVLPEVELEGPEGHVALAMRMRPELNQARLEVEIDELQIVRTKNGLLPLLDLFITLGKTGYSDSFGTSYSNLSEDYYDLGAAIRIQYPFRNRAARSGHERSLLRHEQSMEALNNLTQLAELDVRTAYIEVTRQLEQISATRATRESEEEKLRVEQERFRVGRSTNFLVTAAQRDLLLSRLTEVQAIADYLKALVSLYRQDGSLLQRRGISAPGEKPITLPENKKS
jgi:outer membrane protein TolC